MASGRLSVGSRTPVAGFPAWVTPEVVRGGFATGNPSAGGPLQSHETEAARSFGVPAERRAIATFMQGAVDLDDVVVRTARLLAQLTHQVAIVQYPSAAPASIRHIEIVQVASGRLLLVAIRSNGNVEQRVVECPPVSEDEVTALRGWVNDTVAGLTPDLAVMRLAQAGAATGPAGTGAAANLVLALSDMFEAPSSSRVAVGGVPNLARFGAEYEAMIEPLLQAIEEQVVLLRLLGEAARDLGDVTVRIGAENPYEPLRETSVVTSAYAPRGGLAALGVVGPTRMDYPSTMAAVRAVGRYVSQFLGGDTDVH